MEGNLESGQAAAVPKGPLFFRRIAMVENTYLITPKDLAERLGISDRCLRERRAMGRSLPKYVRVGRFIRYRPKDVEEWINSLEAEGGDGIGLAAMPQEEEASIDYHHDHVDAAERIEAVRARGWR